MPMRIPLTLQQLPSAATATIGGAMLRTAAVRDAMKSEPGAECSAVYKASMALQDCVAFAREVESSARGAFSNWAQVADRPKTDDVKAASANALKSARSARQAEADRLAASAVEAMESAKKTLDAAVANATGPRAFRTNVSGDMARTAALALEAEGQLPSQWLDNYGALLEASDDDDLELYEMSLRPLALAIVSMSASDLRKRVGPFIMHNGTTIGANAPETPERRELCERQRAAAIRFLDAIRDRASTRIPEPVQLALAAFTELVGCFIPLLGFHALTLDPIEYARRFRNPRGNGRPRNPLDVVEDWAERLGVGAAAQAPAAKGKR